MISAIILAAGTSSRMKGSNKLLLPLAGKTSIEIVVENIIASGVEEVIIVTGHEAEAIQQLLQSLPVKFVYNEGYERGMTSSIKKGIAAANGDGYMICLSDMPFITSQDYLQLKVFFEEKVQHDSACICLPVHKGKRSNPVVFSSLYKQEILQHEHEEGCKRILDAHTSNIHYCQVETDGVLRDIDNAEDYSLALSEG